MSVLCLSWLLMMTGAICHFPSERLQLRSAVAAHAATCIFICPGQCNSSVTAIDGLFTQAGGCSLNGWGSFASRAVLKHVFFSKCYYWMCIYFLIFSPLLWATVHGRRPCWHCALSLEVNWIPKHNLCTLSVCLLSADNVSLHRFTVFWLLDLHLCCSSFAVSIKETW